jgi:hypothetical protein
MGRNVGLQIIRGVKANAPALEAGESYLCTDTTEILIGNAGNQLLGLHVFNGAGTRQAACHIVRDQVTLGGGGTLVITLAGLAAFTSAASYAVACADTTANHSVRITQTSGTSFTITGTGGDVIDYIAIGN